MKIQKQRICFSDKEQDMLEFMQPYLYQYRKNKGGLQEKAMKKLGIYPLIVALIFLTCCDIVFFDKTSVETGILSVHLTDAPFPIDLVEEANVTITRIDLKKESDDEDEFITLFEDSLSYNLLTLRNGVTELLAETEVPVGSYQSLLVYVTDASIVMKDSTIYDLKFPGGEESGVKVNLDTPLEVVTAISSDLLLDFDLSRSFVVRGPDSKPDKIQGFIFKPVIRAVNYATAGTIAGTVVDPAMQVLEKMQVWLEADTLVCTAYTNSDGIYGMIGIPAGIYSIYATGEGYDTAFYEGIEVIEANRMIRNFELESL